MWVTMWFEETSGLPPRFSSSAMLINENDIIVAGGSDNSTGSGNFAFVYGDYVPGTYTLYISLVLSPELGHDHDTSVYPYGTYETSISVTIPPP